MPGKPGRPRKNPVATAFTGEATEAVIERLTQTPPTRTTAPVEEPESEYAAQLGREIRDRESVLNEEREASRQARSETRQGTGRSERKPLGSPEQRLSARVPSGMTGRWVNDVPGRIPRAREAGYEFISSDGEVVTNRDGGRSEIVGTGRDGGAMKAFLMAIPTTFYEQDQAAKMSKIKQTEDAILRGEPQQAAPQDTGSFYTPSEGINIRPNTSAER